ncbi:MAG: hypothetical protein IH784_02350 [Bacteroidetes bacterium]|nr:hypothetical protein [Bacteroidota bacterium]
MKHSSRILSLNDAFGFEELEEWQARIKKLLPSSIKFDYFEPDIVNPNESPEILTKLQYPLFTNSLLNISVSTDKGITVNQTTTVS